MIQWFDKMAAIDEPVMLAAHVARHVPGKDGVMSTQNGPGIRDFFLGGILEL